MTSLARKTLLGAITLTVGVVGTWLALPANAEEAGTQNDVSTTVTELKLANAELAAAAPLQFGTKPLEYVTAAATSAAAAADCTIDAKYATALVIAMTWPEVSPSGEPPSPMTLSRYDTQPTLGDPQGRAPGLWFHPGIGMWQLDSAGLGTDFTAAEAMDAQGAANRMAPFIVDRFCGKINQGATAPAARAHAWSHWVACREGACDTIFWRMYNNGVTAVDGVDRFGGAEQRECQYGGATQPCTFVDPAKAQGADWWAQPGGGRSPIAAPFYVLKQTVGGQVTEVRYWLAADSGAATNVVATRPFGANARGGLTWATGPSFCDLTTDRGSC